jgi:hypothetical protein
LEILKIGCRYVLPTIHTGNIFFVGTILVTLVRKLFPDDEPPECSTCDENAWSARGKTWNELECFRGYLIPGIFGGFPEDTFELTRFIPSSWLAKLFNSFLWSFQLTRIPSISRPLLSLSRHRQSNPWSWDSHLLS